MKFFISMLTIILLSTAAGAQNLINQSRTILNAIPLQEYDWATNANVPGSKPSPARGSKFTIVGQTTTDYIISFWDWSSDPTHVAEFAKYSTFNYDAAKSQHRYFLISKTDIDIYSRQRFRQYSPLMGTISFPFKYRPQTGKFEKTFSLSLTGGIRIDPKRRNENTFSFLFGAGPSSVTVDKYNTDAGSNITDPSERTAVTLSLSFMWQWERLQLGLSGGMDNLLDNEVLKWKYQGKPWFSVGVGVALFSNNEVKSPGTN